MRLASRSLLAVLWLIWFWPFVFRAPHRQKRESVTVAGPTRIGLLLETAGIVLAAVFIRPADTGLELPLYALAIALAAVSTLMSWSAVRHLGRQFRVNAGLYHDHELVRSGPYAFVRHPIYTSLFGMLLCTILILTRWEWAAVAIALFLAGTEIRVRTEDRLLASRFGKDFEAYRRQVRAYLPFVR
jgi:protein-S-isoprenylcysteine O-methyltransferase Ste14